VKIGEIVQANQPNIHKQLNNRNYKKKRKRRDKECLSFKYIDYLMRNNKDVDETKCRGRF